MAADPLEFIRTNLPVTPVPFVPEIRLHKAGPKSGLRRLAQSDDAFSSPYWAHYWGGGLVLARFILDRPAIVAGRRVLDLGSGSGIVGIAAAKAGASEVLASDTDRYAVAAIGLNAALNEVAVTPLGRDLTEGLAPPVDVLAAGDLFYEAGLARRVTDFLDRCLESGVEVLVGDPWRAYLPRSRLRLLAEYLVPDFADGDSRTPSAVFSFHG